MLRWTLDEWRRLTDTQSTATGLALDFVEIEVPAGQSAPLRFTFFWLKDSRWEGCDFRSAARLRGGLNLTAGTLGASQLCAFRVSILNERRSSWLGSPQLFVGDGPARICASVTP